MCALAREPCETPVVQSLGDACRWAEHCLAVTRRLLGNDGLLNARAAINKLTLSTAFSGVGAPEVALEALIRAFDEICGGVRESDLEHCLWAFEKNEECRHELRMLRSRPRCLFKDIEELISPSVRDLIMSEGSRLPWLDLVRIFKQPKHHAGRRAMFHSQEDVQVHDSDGARRGHPVSSLVNAESFNVGGGPSAGSFPFPRVDLPTKKDPGAFHRSRKRAAISRGLPRDVSRGYVLHPHFDGRGRRLRSGVVPLAPVDSHGAQEGCGPRNP